MSPVEFDRKALHSVFNVLPVGVLVAKLEGGIVFSNIKAEVILGFNENELLGKSIHDLVPDRFREAHKSVVKKFIEEPSSRAMSEGRMLPALKKSGEEIQIQIGLNPLLVDDEVFILVSIIEAENKVLKVASYYDSLTGLPNRFLFNSTSEKILTLAARNNMPLGVIFIDLDDFKTVNDELGHDAGDQVLVKVATILSNNIRKNDLVSRLGGDEFLICLYGMNAEQLKGLADKLSEQILLINDRLTGKANINVSVGAVSCYNLDKYSIEDLVNCADKLMYKAKRAGKGRIFIEER